MIPNVSDDRAKQLERAMARHYYSGDALLEVLETAPQLYGYLSPPVLKPIARGPGSRDVLSPFSIRPVEGAYGGGVHGNSVLRAGGIELMSALRGADTAEWTEARLKETRNPSAVKYVVCNADEGNPGACMNRSVLEGDPHRVLEGLAIAARAVGAEQGYIYARGESPPSHCARENRHQSPTGRDPGWTRLRQ